MSEIVLEPTTAAIPSDPIPVYEDKLNGRLPITLICVPILPAGKEAPVEISYDGGINYVPLVISPDFGVTKIEVKFTENMNAVSLPMTGLYRVNKPVTVAPTGFYASHKNNL